MFIYYETDGRIVSESLTEIPELTYPYIVVDLAPTPRFGYVSDTFQFVETSPPSLSHSFDYTTKTWIDRRSLNELKNLRNEYVNQSRAKANQTSFTYLGKEIATDPLSRSDIDATHGMVLMTGSFSAGWPGGWKCLDNTYIPITTVAAWHAFYTAMVNQGTANFAHAQTLKAQIAAATTIQEVEAIVW